MASSHKINDDVIPMSPNQSILQMPKETSFKDSDKKGVDRPNTTPNSCHFFAAFLIFRGLSTDFVACKFVTGIGWFGGVYCD